MTLPGRIEPHVVRRALAGFLSAVLHFGVALVIVLSGGRYDGVGASETSLAQLVMIEAPLMAGIPAAAKRRLTATEQRRLHQPSATYTELARTHRRLAEAHPRRRG